ncbi:hypothetical protein TSMEX_001883 [Taenia solium]|eukprot:TsM_000144700 transcript=TsM_000144700 gene=TsM_000144700
MNGTSNEELDEMRSFFKGTNGALNNDHIIDTISFTEWTEKMDRLDPKDLKALYNRARFLFDHPKFSVQRDSSKLSY